MVMIAGAAVALLAAAGVGAFALRGGGSEPVAAQSQAGPATEESTAIATALGTPETAVDANAASNITENVAVAEMDPQASDQAEAREELRSERAKSAAAEAKLAAMRKAAAKTPAAPSAPGAATKANGKTAAADKAKTASTASKPVSAAKLAQFNTTVDAARALAKVAMRSRNRENAALARNYDKYLKTLKDSGRGVKTDKEADSLIKQANQTRAYIQFLLKQDGSQPAPKPA
ncbi:MAG: hypothetical protein ACR2KH_01000 [Sphingomicrobium sp.]